MTQSRRHSALESATNVAVGMVISIAISTVIYPWFGHAFTLMQNVWITTIFTVISFIRGYAVRRAFNWMHKR